jgi:hypothetical protein
MNQPHLIGKVKGGRKMKKVYAISAMFALYLDVVVNTIMMDGSISSEIMAAFVAAGFSIGFIKAMIEEFNLKSYVQ